MGLPWRTSDERASTPAPDEKHHSGIQYTLGGSVTSAPPSGFAPTEARSGILPKVWTDGEESNTDVSRSTVATALACRSEGRPRLAIMTGARAGEVITLDMKDELVIGRSRESDCRLNEAGVSRIHCRFFRGDQGYSVEDLGSTNGTRVNGVAISRATLQSGDRVQIGDNLVIQFALLDNAEESLAQHLYEMSTRDPLTGAVNRRYFSARLDAELAHARRHNTPLSLMLLDLDFFKSVNDEFGHAAGDLLLKAVVDEIQVIIRAEDLLSRHGGEEFALLVRAATVDNAACLAERIRTRIEALEVTYEGRAIRATISIGVAGAVECAGGTQDELLAITDRRLYAAKTHGRNRVVSF
jgi:two-component system, cell cycle response regulator